MDKISNIIIKPLKQSMYLKPVTMHFTQNGKQRTWDMVEVSHHNVAVIICNYTRNVLVFVKQFRPAVYVASIPEKERQEHIDEQKYPAELGITIELCAGIADKNLLLEEIARDEILEECGYKVNLSSLEKISTFRSGVGTLGSLQTLFYCEVTDDMKVSQGGGVDDEIIDVVEMSVPEMKKYLQGDKINSPASFIFAMYWFLQEKQR